MKILADEVYTGDMVQGKTKTVGHRQVPTDPKDWVVVRNTHPPLISRELFERAQAVRAKATAKAKASAEKVPYTKNILRGRIFCGHCGRNLHRERNQQHHYYYHCIANQRIGKDVCTSETYMREEALFDVILTIIRQQAENVIGENLRLQRCGGKLSEQKAEVEREISKLSQETEKNRMFLFSLYNNFVKGVITKAEHGELRQRYEQKISEAVERVQQLQEQQAILEQQIERYATLADRLAAVKEDTALSALLVDQLIERVTVNGPNDISVRFTFERHLHIFFVAAALAALCIAPAHALEYTIDGADDYLFGRPTSDDTIYEWENPNVDRSKNTALIPPGFGTPTSYLPNSGEYLTPNLVPGALSGGLVNQVGSVGNPDGGSSVDTSGSGYPVADTSVDSSGFPTVDADVSGTGGQATAFTEVSSDLYYSNGSLGTLKIPSIGLTVGVYEGTGSAPLLKGAGHFEGTSIWLGNVCLAGHNRGVRNDFGKIHTLKSGDTITFTTVLGTMTYSVSSVTKVAVTDTSGLSATAENCITLYTCVENQPSYRWCVKAVSAS